MACHRIAGRHRPSNRRGGRGQGGCGVREGASTRTFSPMGIGEGTGRGLSACDDFFRSIILCGAALSADSL